MSVLICIAGGGASGMMAAITAARNGAGVILLERSERVGRKLLLTGNGKCNFTNLDMDPEYYHTEKDSFAMKSVSRFGPQDTISFFRRIGVEPVTQKNNMVYPYSCQASSVQNALRGEMNRLNVKTVTDCRIKRAVKEKDASFRIFTDRGDFRADRFILATGSFAGTRTQPEDSGYRLAETFGHKIVKPLPALCSLLCDRKEFFSQAAGVRAHAKVTLFSDNAETDSNTGEMQITSTALSGIPVFQISRSAVRALESGKEVRCEVDFFPECEDIPAFLKNRAEICAFPDAEAFGNGFLNKNLWLSILKSAGIRSDASVRSLSDKDIRTLADAIGHLSFRVLRSSGFENAQICTGGICTSEIDPGTMESKLIPGLYFAGEIIDVDGICGGYNLQWAWTSGHLAGMSASEA